MATIKAFRALHPNPFYADRLVFPGDELVFFFGIQQREFPLRPLKEELETPARQRPETEEGQRAAYQAINASLASLLELGRLQRDQQPGIYIYEIVHRDYRQTGIWALTDVRDPILLHEQTLADSERRIRNYREHTGLEGSPVLLTYEPSAAINRIIAETCAGDKKVTVGNKKSQHRIWQIRDPAILKQLTAAFREVDKVYMADGHHRLAAAAGSGGFISSLYLATDQLRIREYYRVVMPGQKIQPAGFLRKLREQFSVTPAGDNLPVRPAQPNSIGMCLDGQWFELMSPAAARNAALLLQNKLLAPVFGIADPRTDTRLKCIGGEFAMEETLGVLKAVPEAIAFTLCPMTVAELIAAAGTGTILPPKSSWIDPKIPYGLLLVRHSTKTDTNLNHYD